MQVVPPAFVKTACSGQANQHSLSSVIDDSVVGAPRAKGGGATVSVTYTVCGEFAAPSDAIERVAGRSPVGKPAMIGRTVTVYGAASPLTVAVSPPDPMP